MDAPKTLVAFPESIAVPGDADQADSAEVRFRLMRARHAAVYVMLHHVCAVVADVLTDTLGKSSHRKQGMALIARAKELHQAAQCLHEYGGAPPDEIANSYASFCADIASNATLRHNNEQLANHYRRIFEDREKVAIAIGLPRDSSGEDIVNWLKERGVCA